jgi:prevent-host-death family protein
MADTVNLHAAKTHLSRLVDRALSGEDIVIARSGRPLVRLVPVGPRPVRRPGLLRGKLHVPADFNEPLPPEVLNAFYNGPIEPPKRRRK